jgi:hypothetical protein
MYRVYEERFMVMQEWTVDHPQVIDVDEPVTELAIRIVAGHVDVVTVDDPRASRVEVTDIEDAPLLVSIDGGVLTIQHERVSWDGILGWLRSDRKLERRRAVVSVAVPQTCSARIGVVSASAVIAGLTGEVRVRCVSGEVVLDEVTGEVDVESVSGDVEARNLNGELSLRTVSGGLTVVDGRSGQVRAKSVSGDVALDLHPDRRIDIDVTTVSGDVTVRLPATTGVTVDLASTSGDLACACDGLNLQKRPGSRRLSGSIGDGAGALHGRTVSGRVALLTR